MSDTEERRKAFYAEQEKVNDEMFQRKRLEIAEKVFLQGYEKGLEILFSEWKGSRDAFAKGVNDFLAEFSFEAADSFLKEAAK